MSTRGGQVFLVIYDFIYFLLFKLFCSLLCFLILYCLKLNIYIFCIV